MTQSFGNIHNAYYLVSKRSPLIYNTHIKLCC